jgi:hypothetical protein
MAYQVWTCNLLLYSFNVGEGAVGEPWVTPASYLQVLGFATLLAGTITYAQVWAPSQGIHPVQHSS